MIGHVYSGLNNACINCGAAFGGHGSTLPCVPKTDMVNSPPHYSQGGIECIEAIEAALTPEEYRGFIKGTIMRYTWRLGLKDAPLQEIGKAGWYANRYAAYLKQTAKIKETTRD